MRLTKRHQRWVGICSIGICLAAIVSTANAQQERLEVRSKGLQQAESLTGFSDAIDRLPFSINLINVEALKDFGANALSDVLRSEPAVSDAYNTLGYPENFAVRGILIDPRLNYRREGLPVNGHAPIAFENKASVLVLKGASGMFAGSSSPGGMVDFVLKRPGSEPIRSATLSLSERGTRYVAADLANRVGEAGSLGYRINLASEQRRPMAESAPGERQFASVFLDWRMPTGGLLEWNFERHLYSQISVPGASLLGGQSLPPVLPRRNMNDQPWSLPFESRESASAFRLFQPVGKDWMIKASSSVQSIRTDDRLAFPDGCSSENLYPGFCADGGADLYDYRSLNERRLSHASALQLEGKLATGRLSHQVTFGLRNSRLSEKLEPTQAYNWVGLSNYFGSAAIEPNPSADNLNRNRLLSTKEWSIQDRINWGGPLLLWFGVRRSTVEGKAALSDGAESIAFEQGFTTPFAAIGYESQGFQYAYLSYAQGVETDVVPNRLSYRDAGTLLPAQRSKQWEASLRKPWSIAGGPQGQLSMTLFRIDRPSAADVKVGPDGDVGSLQRIPAAILARHQGLELQANMASASLGQLQWAAQLIDAKTLRSTIEGMEGAPLQAREGAAVINVAPWTMHLLHRWPLANPDWQWQNRFYAVGSKPVLLSSASVQDPALSLPSRWQWDSALNWQQKLPKLRLRWTLAVNNVLDRADWREAPTQSWGGSYLFPVQPRSLRFAVQAHW